MNDARPEAVVRLEGELVHVTGEGLDSSRHTLFFSTVLGCRHEGDAWICPTRGHPGSDLVVRIASELNGRGYRVTAEGEQADLALTHEVERVRSFGRAREAARHYLGLNGEVEPEALVDEDEVLAVLADYGWDNEARPLLPHQRQGLMHALHATNAANFSVPGAGKTATALAVIGTHLAQEHVDVVVVVGPLSCFRPWEREAEASMPGKLNVQRLRNLHRTARAGIYRRAGRGDLLLLSFATAAGDAHELERLCRRVRVMLVIDESHRIKRFRGGQWAPALMHVARFARVKMILTGTPMPHGPKDLWSQFNVLWPGSEATGSRAAYASRADANFDSVRGDLEPFFVRTPKAELGLTPLQLYEHAIPLAPVQRDIYELIVHRLRQGVPDAASWRDRIDALRRARPIRLIQAASNPDLLNEEDGFFHIPPISTPSGTLMERLHRYREFGELPAKFEWALDFLAGLKAEGRKCVVWTSFVRNIDQFSELVRDRLDIPVYAVDGRIPAADVSEEAEGDELDETRESRIDDFLAEEGAAVLVANPAACAESISLHSSCFVAVYLDRTHDCARWLQSIDRIHRLGLPEGVTVEIHVLKVTNEGRDTVDELVAASLAVKGARMQSLLEEAELRGTGLEDQDTLRAAEGNEDDLDALLRYLLGEE